MLSVVKPESSEARNIHAQNQRKLQKSFKFILPNSRFNLTVIIEQFVQSFIMKSVIVLIVIILSFAMLSVVKPESSEARKF